ncbi:MAG TPA: DedA family protein [Streptosporangiaceae bacterium]|nr:DedA family protein [Streptosporangiaceae bacterium]
MTGTGAYLAVFLLMTLTFIGIPAVGPAVVGWAAVQASHGELDIVLVLIVAALGAEAGGLIGYGIGTRWGRRLLDLPGPWRERRRSTVARAEALYAKWGRLAIFFTPTLVSGMLRMKYSQFVVWNFVVGSVYVLSVGPAAYGAGKVVANEQDWESLAALVAGLAIAAGCAMLAARYYRRRRARRFAGRAGASRVSTDEAGG